MKYEEKNAIQISDSEKAIRKIESSLLSSRIKSYNLGLADILWLGVGGVVIADVTSGVMIAKNGTYTLPVLFIILFPVLLQIFAGIMTIVKFYKYQGDAVAVSTAFAVPKLFYSLTIILLLCVIKPQSIALLTGQISTFYLVSAIFTIVGVAVWLAYFYCSFEVECAIPKKERYWSKIAKIIMSGYTIYYVCLGILLCYGFSLLG